MSSPAPTVMAVSANEHQERRPLGWLHMVDGRFAALLTDRLQSIERYVSEGLEWLQGVRRQQQHQPRQKQKQRQKPRPQQEPEPGPGEGTKGDREIANANAAGAPTSTGRGRRRRRGRAGRDVASTVEAPNLVGGAIHPVTGEMRPAISADDQPEKKEGEEKGAAIAMAIRATPLRPPPTPTVPDSVTALRIVEKDGADAMASLLITTATKRKRGRLPKNDLHMEPSTAMTPPVLAVQAADTGRRTKTPRIGGTLKKRPPTNAAVAATPPTVAAPKRSRLVEGTPGPDLSSIDSPLKTPAPVNYIRQQSVQARGLAPIPLTAAIEDGSGSTKIEAWTSKFVVRNSGAPALATISDAGTLAAVSTNVAAHRALVPIVEIAPPPPPLPPPGECEPEKVNHRTAPVTAVLPILAAAATPIRTVPPSNVTAVEFVPPPTVTRRMASVRHQLHNGRTDGIPADYVESPLTRARRVDAQNTWREAQLKTFLAAKADMVKVALGSLRSGGREREGTQAQVPVLTQTLNQEQQLDHVSDAERKGKRDDVLKENPLPSSAPGSGGSPRSGKASGGAMSIVNLETTVLPPTTLQAKTAETGDPHDRCVFIAEEQPPLATITAAAGALNDDLIFDFNPSSKARPASHSPVATAMAMASPSSSVRRGDSSGEGHSNDFSSASSLPDPPMMMVATEGAEAERRRRLKERNERAVEKKKLLLQKAQQIRSQTVANLSGKPKALPSGRRIAGAGTNTNAGVSAATLGKSFNDAGTGATKASTISSSALTAGTAASLQKQAMINSIISQNMSVTKIEAHRAGESRLTTPQKSEGVFKMPLPKVKTPGSVTRGGSGEHPSSDDTFTTSAAVSTAKAASPSLIKTDMVAAVSSPKLPQIVDSSEEETEDELTSRAPQGRENRPPWANTPEVSKSLLQQRSIRPEDIFGEVEPVKLEEPQSDQAAVLSAIDWLMNFISAIFLITIMGGWIHLAGGVLVTFKWLNGFRLAQKLSVETDIGHGFTKKLFPGQDQCDIELSLHSVQAIRKITITWLEGKRVWEIPSERLPTKDVGTWSIKLN